MGCDNCADTGTIDWGAISLKCSRCNGTGNVTDQANTDTELGRMVRRLVEINGTLEIDNISTPFGVQSGMFGQFSAETLDESMQKAVRKALEATQ